ncbi:MAG: O-antigen ligase family protein [bacterium]|nr:O-antigen ligase family protein [bacterium]
MSKTELYLSKIVKYGLYAILLTPLAFWPKALYAFLTPKFLLFQILVEIVFGAWLILQLIDSRNQSVLRKNYILLALSGFIAVSLLSAVFGIDLGRSFWGIGARMTGLFAELHFFAWFLVLVSYFKNDRKEWNRYINFSFAVSTVVAVTGFFTVLEWRLVPGYTIFSNPTFVAPYFLFHFFWGLYQIWNSKSWQKLYYVSASALILWAIFLGQIRGAFIGLFLGILFLGIGLIFSNIFKVRSRVLIAVLYAIIVLSLILGWQFRDSKFIEQSYFGRFSHISFKEATVQTRFLTWQTAFKGFYDKPLLGVGPENFNYLFNARYNPRLLMYGGSSFAETWQDKPHNAFIEILTETGIIGGLAYILIWLFVIFYLFRIFSAKGGSALGGKRGEKFLSLILASAFIAYFGAIFFSFDSFGSWFGLYLFLAFLASHNNNSNLPARNAFSIADAGGQIYPNSTNINQNLKKLVVVFVCISILGLLGVNLSIWRANLADADAIRYFGRDSSVGIVLFNKSLNYSTPYKSEYQFDLIASVGGAIEKSIPINNLEDTVNFALNEADKAVLAHPNNAGSYTDMLRIYNILGTRGRDPEILNQAEIFGKKSLELSPNRQETLFYLARTALLKNNSKLAVQLTKQAVDIDSAINLSHWYSGLSYIADGQTNEGAAEIKKALELGYQPKNETEKNFIKNLDL